MKTNHALIALVAIAGLAVAGQAHAVTINATTNVGTTSGVVNTTVQTTMSTTTATAGVDTSAGMAGTVTTDADAQADLEAVVGTIKASNAAVATVTTTDDTQVSVNYSHPAKLFGFISVMLTEKASVVADASGKTAVSVATPWWSVFTTSEVKSSELASEIQARIAASANTMNTATIDGKLSPSVKAYLLSQIEAGAEATYSTDVQ